MKRIVISALLALLACVSCTPQAATTIGEYHSAEERFAALADGIADGTDMPAELVVSVDRRASGSIADPDEVLSCWNALTSVEIVRDELSSAPSIEDGGILFEFRWADGRTFAFEFITDDYYVVEGGVIKTADPGSVDGLAQAAVEYLEAGGAGAPGMDPAASLDFSDGSFAWDGDGDGTPETYSIAARDKGGEKGGYVEISQVENPRFSVRIEGAYAIEGIYALEDEDGACLRIEYLQGDPGSPGTATVCYLRIIGGAFALDD